LRGNGDETQTLWKPLLTQYTLSEAHRNAQCNGTRTLFFFSGSFCNFTASININRNRIF
jgi:polyisoprenoid-binding protein YceI